MAGAAGSNECPAGSVRIETEAACRTAATAAGKTFGWVETSATSPRGCYYFSDNTAYFNTHAVGAGGNSYYQLLCAAGAATTGAPLKRSACTGARPSRAVCIIHGRHIDARTYISRFLYTCLYPYDADGARRRCRAAHGSAGGRRAGVHGHGT